MVRIEKKKKQLNATRHTRVSLEHISSSAKDYGTTLKLELDQELTQSRTLSSDIRTTPQPSFCMLKNRMMERINKMVPAENNK